MDRTIAEVLSATIGGYFTNWWEHPTFCVIIDESHIAVTQNIGCSPLLSLHTYRIDTSSQYGGVFPLEAWERGWRIRNSYLPEYGSV